MNTYQKLNIARGKFHQQKLKKSGLNKFAGYSYFELSDFLIPALNLFGEVGLCSTISFTKDFAEMRIVNVENPDEFPIVISSPMGSAALKGCHEVQNIGAVETYQTRYLFVQALCIVEHDILDATTGQTPVKRQTPTDSVVQLDEDSENKLIDIAIGIEDIFSQGDIVGAYKEYLKVTDDEEKTFLWKKLTSTTKSAIKKHGESLK
jgi:hypothetical protein